MDPELLNTIAGDIDKLNESDFITDVMLTYGESDVDETILVTLERCTPGDTSTALVIKYLTFE